MEIIHFSAECYPVAKVGGLGDVVGALPTYQNRLGHVAKVVMPAYNTKFLHQKTVLHQVLILEGCSLPSDLLLGMQNY